MNKISFEPVIKWSGSKRSQAEQILKYFPNTINTYFEPFCGGASVLRKLLDSEILVKYYICNDINKDLIELWKEIKNNPNDVANYYEKLWNELNIDDDKNRKREYFNFIRTRLNKEHNPLDFMFIMRTTTNGMPRYNNKGEFNNSFHITRNGINPNKLRKIIQEWSLLLNQKDVIFTNYSYKDIKPSVNDFMYLDPPYANTKGIYYGSIDNDELFNWLRCVNCKYIMSFDGISGKIDNTYEVPKDVYIKHDYILSGNSSFKRTMGISNDSIVYESLYIK